MVISWMKDRNISENHAPNLLITPIQDWLYNLSSMYMNIGYLLKVFIFSVCTKDGPTVAKKFAQFTWVVFFSFLFLHIGMKVCEFPFLAPPISSLHTLQDGTWASQLVTEHKRMQWQWVTLVTMNRWWLLSYCHTGSATMYFPGDCSLPADSQNQSSETDTIQRGGWSYWAQTWCRFFIIFFPQLG